MTQMRTDYSDRHRVVKPQRSDLRFVREAFRRHPGFAGLEQYETRPTTEDDWAARMSGARHVVHFFDDGPIPTSSILRARPNRIIIAGPVGDCIDLAAIEGCTTKVTGWSGLTVNAVAEFTAALMCRLARPVPAGDGPCAGVPTFGLELRGSTLGIVGFGRIGRAVATIARGFGMTILTASSSLTAAEADACGVQLVTLSELAARSAVVSVHARSRPDSVNMLDAAFLRSMPSDAILINTARPELLDLQALRTQLRSGSLAGVALDLPAGVLEPGDELLTSPRVHITPHMAWMTAPAVDALIHRAWLEVSRDRDEEVIVS